MWRLIFAWTLAFSLVKSSAVDAKTRHGRRSTAAFTNQDKLDPDLLIPMITTDDTFIVGSVGNLQCVVSTNYTDASYTVDWIRRDTSGSDVILGKNGTAGTEDRRIVAGATLSVDGIEYTLQIRDVEMSDQATYICQVRGPQGSIEGEKSVSIEVKVEEDCEYYSEGDGCDYGGGDLTSPGGHPSLVTSAGRSSQAGMKVHHIALMKGDEEVVLDCHTEADIKAAPEDVVWLSSEGRLTRRGNQVMLLKQETWNSGTYYCLVPKLASTQAQVDAVERAPQLASDHPIVDGHHIVQVSTGQKTKLHCKSEGNPPPSVTWYKEETDELLFGGSEKAVTRKRWTEVSPSTEFEPTFEFKGESIDNYLSISHVKSKHYRRYKCQASNRLGQAQIILEMIPPRKTRSQTSGGRVNRVKNSWLLPVILSVSMIKILI